MNKLIVVTGGTKGIGRAIIEKFAAAHFDIVTCSRNTNDLQQLKDSIERKHGVAVFIRQTDMAQTPQVKMFTDFVTALNRPVDILVNNTGYFVPGQIYAEADGVLESMINANLYSTYHATRGLVKAMIERRAGHIFNLCSIASIKAYPNGGSYAITKFAMLGLSKCLREELKEFNIRVTAIMPGATLTASWDGVNLPADRFIKSEDVAETLYATYNLSDRSVIEEIIIRPLLGDI